MPESTVGEVMSRHVITAGLDSGFKELIWTLATHELEAIPVVHATGRPVGVVSERDLLTKMEYHGGTEPAPLLPGSACRARWRKSRALVAADLMSTPVITAPARTAVGVAAQLMSTHRLCLLCVTDHAGVLIGVLSRANLPRLYLRSDGVIQADIDADIDNALTGAVRAPHRVSARVRGAVVTLEGTVNLHSTALNAARIAHHVNGVIAVRNQIEFDLDDHMITGM